MMAKPMKTVELHYPTIQVFIIIIIHLGYWPSIKSEGWLLAKFLFLPVQVPRLHAKPLITARTGLRHSRDFEGCQNIFGLFNIHHILWKLDKIILRERTVSSSFIIRGQATIWTAAMHLYFFHFEVRVASRDRGGWRVTGGGWNDTLSDLVLLK